MPLMPLEYGRYFYHYTSWRIASQQIIPTRKLRLSPYALMRDPLESQAPMLGSGMSYAPGDDDAAAKLGQAHLDAQRELGRLRSHSKVLSLTVDAAWAAAGPEYDRRFGMGWARARMWEQYADNHAGVVLIFAREPFEKVVLGQLQARSPGALAGAVHYTRTGLAGSFASSIMLTYAESGSEQARRHLERNAAEYFFTKLTDWESEYEYRFIEPGEAEDYSYVDVGNTLVGFMAGHKFPETLEKEAISLAWEHGIEHRQILWAFNGPMEGKFKSA